MNKDITLVKLKQMRLFCVSCRFQFFVSNDLGYKTLKGDKNLNLDFQFC